MGLISYLCIEQQKQIIMITEVQNELKTKVLSTEGLETNSHVLMAAEDGSVLDFTRANSLENRALRLQHVEFGEINYERKSDWMRLVNKLNAYDDTPIKRLITGDKKSSDWGALIVHREDIQYSEDGFLIEFKEPVMILIETIGDKAIVVEANKIKGKITYEWYYRGEGLDGYANGLEIYIHEVEIVE